FDVVLATQLAAQPAKLLAAAALATATLAVLAALLTTSAITTYVALVAQLAAANVATSASFGNRL
ncbi:hypothetical protein U1Q18_012397, partial [Sarracenia purpurea var. burkii]